MELKARNKYLITSITPAVIYIRLLMNNVSTNSYILGEINQNTNTNVVGKPNFATSTGNLKNFNSQGGKQQFPSESLI